MRWMGSPISNTGVRIVNRFGQTLPEGVVGELLIGGAGVAHGYLTRDDLTATRFIDSLEFQIAATDGPCEVARENQHPGAHFPGRGATGRINRHQNGVFLHQPRRDKIHGLDEPNWRPMATIVAFA